MPKPKPRKLPPIGTMSVKNYKGTLYTMRVVKWRDRIGFSVSGNTYKTPTAAANAIAKPKPTVGYFGVLKDLATGNPRATAENA